VKARLLIHCGGITPFISLARMKALGVAMTILPSLGFVTASRAVHDAGNLVLREGIDGFRKVLEGVQGHPMEDFNEFIGFGAIRALEEAYEPIEASRAYEHSVGYRPAGPSH
jgi:hypothetical protein